MWSLGYASPIAVKRGEVTLIVSCLLWALFGLVFGSFFNVLIYRIPAGESIVHPGSRCPHCGYVLTARDLVPVISYLLLKGRCRQCQAAISPQYPVVEAASGGLFFAACWLGGNIWQSAAYALFLSLLLLCFVTDLYTKRIPNVYVVPGMGAALFFAALGWTIPLRDSALGLLLGLGVMLLIHVVSRGGMGMGDVKMMGMIGGFLGPLAVLYTLFGASLFGSIIGIAYLVKTKQGRKTPIPFGPFLAAAAAGIWVYLLVA